MNWVRNFRKDVSGGFAMWFAVSAMTLAIVSGAAIDINHAHRAERYLQDLNDNAALAAAKDHTLKTGEKKKVAKGFIEAAFDLNYDLKIMKVKLEEGVDGTVQVTTTAEINTMMMGMLGKDSLKVKAYSEVNQFGSGGPVEISFILDTTSSMNAYGANWNQVVNALEDLMVDMAKKAGKSGNFKASFVPFSDRVNLGDKKFDWIDMSFLADPTAASAYKGCAEPRPEMVSGNPHTLTNRKPGKLPFTPSTVGTYDYVTTCPSVPIAYPTDDITKVKTALKSITPSGTGRFDIGLAWGYRMLSNNWRKTIGGGSWPDKDKVKKIAVFLTDGYSYAYEKEVGPPVDPRPWGWNHGTPEGFLNLANVCSQMKADDIKIYVIGVNVQPHALSTFKNCATDADHYLPVSSLGSVLDAIGSIGAEAGEMRLVD